MASYDEEFKKRIVRMHLEEGRTIKSLSDEYHVSENGIGYWLKKYREECSKDPAAKEEYDLMKENLRTCPHRIKIYATAYGYAK